MIKSKEKNNEKTKNDKNDDDNNSDSGDYLNFIKINKKNKIEEEENEEHIHQLIIFSNTLTIENENNIGQEMNKFFNLILNENKEGEPLKVNIAISNRLYKDKNINKTIDIILNSEETTYIVLNGELSKNISLVLTNVYQKIKNNNKISNFNELLEKVNDYNFIEGDILKKYLITRYDKINESDIINSQKSIDFVVNISRYTMKQPNTEQMDKDINNDDKSIKTQNKNTKNQINNNIKDEDTLYQFKEFEKDKDLDLPPEMLILRRKFQKVKKMKLIINNKYHKKNKGDNNFFSSNSFHSSQNNININTNSYDNINNNDNDNVNENILRKEDIDYNIFVLLNLKWLFPQLIEIEIDLSDDNIIKDQINLYKSNLKKFSKFIKRSIKETNLNFEKAKEKINFDPLRGSIFPNIFQSEDNDNQSFSLEIKEDNEFSKDENNFSDDIINNNNVVINNNNDINIIENNKIIVNNFDNFIKKYQYSLQMIIIYGFFISKIPQLFFCNFTLPFNLEKEIIRMLQIQQLFLPDFNFLSFLSDMQMIRITIDFNSLDNKTFQDILSLLYKNVNLRICQLNFFPSEKYFESELLFKLLQDSNPSYKSTKFNSKIIHEIQPNEDIDIFLLKSLSEYFEININKLFQTLCIRSTVSELSLIFNIPSIMSRIDYYYLIILKLIMNLFIVIDNSKLTLTSFIIQTNNFCLDSKKYPFLIEFLDKMYIFSNKELKLSKLTFQMKLINITNIYRIIPYNIIELSIGEFDCESFLYFVEYITSSEFSLHSKLNKLKINLSHTILYIDDIYEYLLKLYTDYPKHLKEISINIDLKIRLKQLNELLNCTNYNTIENIFMTFSKKSLNYKEYEDKIINEIFYLCKDKALNEENYIPLYFVKRTNKTNNMIKNNIMMNLSLKYNKKFMDYDIFKSLERFVCIKLKKNYIIQFK